MLYNYTIYPLECVYKVIYLIFHHYVHSYGVALILLSIFTYCITHPLMKWASGIQKDENEVQSYMKPQLDKIKAELKGAEQHHAIQRLYKRYAYHPAMAIRSAVGVMLQLPFLMAAYYMLSNLAEIHNVSWLFFKDLGAPDKLLFKLNIMPVVMTLVNLASAFTTPGFSKKDRIQAGVIAVLFLVLLYKAPVALLIYWTFNNLWTLLGNLLNRASQKYGFVIPSLTIKGKSPWYWLGKTPDYVYICGALAMTCALLVPLNIYIGNINELWFKFDDLLPWFFSACIVLLAVLVAIYFALCKENFRACFLALVTGLVLAVFVQSYVINLNYGVLDGAAIKWEKFEGVAIYNTLAWLVCLLLPFGALYYFKDKKFLSLAKQLCLLLVIVQLGSLVYEYIHHPVEKKDSVVLTTAKMRNVSQKDNIIVFVLDYFDFRFFDDILEKDPWVKDQLLGFTYYKDATSVFGNTTYALPHIGTGRVYKNNALNNKFLADAWGNSDFLKFLKSKNYESTVYTMNQFVSGKADIANKASSKNMSLSNTVMQHYAELALFRMAPHSLKKNFVIYTGDLLQPKLKNTKDEPYVEDDVKFYNNIKQGLTADVSKNAFRLYHLNGAHPPFTMTKDVTRLPKGQKSDQHVQALGALKIVFQYLNDLKKVGAYDNATIAIVADHGVWSQVGHGPLIMVKQPGAENKPLEISSNPVSLINLHATLLKRYLGDQSKFGVAYNVPNNAPRYVYYNGAKRAFNEWKVVGYAGDTKSWTKGKTIPYIANGGKNAVYKLGKNISFALDGEGDSYLTKGWGTRRPDAVNSKDTQACLQFKLAKIKKDKLELVLELNPIRRVEGAVLPPVTVKANGKKIATWKITKRAKYKATFPAELVKNGKLDIILDIPGAKKDGKQQYGVRIFSGVINEI